MMKILRYPDPRLRIVSQEVKYFDGSLNQLLEEMAKSMYSAGGIGLAAPQVGKPLRLFIIEINKPGSSSRELIEFINPKLTEKKGRGKFEEGCLSLPGSLFTIKRSKTVVVEYQDRTGRQETLTADELLSVAIQHEHDHLEGILMVDRLPFWKRLFFLKKLKNQRVK